MKHIYKRRRRRITVEGDHSSTEAKASFLHLRRVGSEQRKKEKEEEEERIKLALARTFRSIYVRTYERVVVVETAKHPRAVVRISIIRTTNVAAWLVYVKREKESPRNILRTQKHENHRFWGDLLEIEREGKKIHPSRECPNKKERERRKSDERCEHSSLKLAYILRERERELYI